MYFISLLPSSGHERPTIRAVHLSNNGDLKLERLILQLAFFNIFGNAEAGGRITCAFDGVYNNDLKAVCYEFFGKSDNMQVVN